MADTAVTLSDAVAARVGAAIASHTAELSGAVSFKAGCGVVVRIASEVLKADDILMSVRSTFPEFEVHAHVHRETGMTIVDSRESDFLDLRPVLLDFPAVWSMDLLERMHVEIRTAAQVAIDHAAMVTVTSLLSPYLELTRRMERIQRASTLLDIAVDPQITRHSESVFLEIARRIGETLHCPAALYIRSTDGEDNVEPLRVFEGTLAPLAAQHIFSSLEQVAGGPIERAFDGPPQAAPTTLQSMSLSAHGRAVNQLIQQLQIADYVAIKMLGHGETIGVLALLGVEGRRFTVEDVALAASLAWAAGLAIPIAQSQRTIRRRLQESELLRHLTNVSHRHRNESETLRMATNVARVIFGADYVAIGTIETDHFSLTYWHVSGNLTAEHQRAERHVISSAIRSWVDMPRPYIITDRMIDNADMSMDLLVHRAEGLRTSMSAGVKVLGKKHTLFMIAGFRRPAQFDDEELHFASALVQTIATSL